MYYGACMSDSASRYVLLWCMVTHRVFADGLDLKLIDIQPIKTEKHTSSCGKGSNCSKGNKKEDSDKHKYQYYCNSTNKLLTE